MNTPKPTLSKANANAVRNFLRGLKEYRRCLPSGDPHHTQAGFWERFGVTQSGGSRYENGRDIDRPLALLLAAHRTGLLTDDDLIALNKGVDGLCR